MYPRDIRIENPTEALIVEQALAMYRELKRTADAAPDGQVLAQAEKLAVAQGRELTRKNLEAVLGEQAHEVEKKGRARPKLFLPRRATPPRPAVATNHHRGRHAENPTRVLRLPSMQNRSASVG